MKFVIEGQPVGKGRPRFARRGKFVQTYNPQKTQDYEKEVVVAFLRQCKDVADKCYGKEVKMKIWAYFEPIKSISKKKYNELIGQAVTKKPDWDNIGKIISDSLNGVAYKDDSQISSVEVYKRYDHTARVEVEITYEER